MKTSGNRQIKQVQILLVAIGCTVLLACNQQLPAESSAAPEPVTIQEVISVTGGSVRGLVSATSNLKQFHGIPYAAPPTRMLRWSPPQPVLAWDDVRDGSTPGPACMQPQGQGGEFYGATGFAMDEDCLTLNVWTRAITQSDQLPVMVWIHGGALVTGQGSSYPGELLTSKGVVLVTINYRLGRFGFHAHPELSAEVATGTSGNQGLKDQIAALEWVQDNISVFGGNPNNVTIFGESAGSLSMSLLQASPLAKGLFHRVIGESGGAFQPMSYRAQATSYAKSAETLGVEFAQALVSENEDSSLQALRQISQEHILDITNSNPDFSNYDSLAIVDGEVIPEEVSTIFAKGQQSDVPVLIGSNKDEGSTFLPFFTPLFGEGLEGFNAYVKGTLPEVDISKVYPASTNEQAETAWQDVFNDVLFTYPMRVWARSMENVESDAYLYLFTWAPPIEDTEIYGSFHAAEIGYIFGNLDLFGAKPTDADREFSDTMASIWTQFAKTGNPNGENLPRWTPYSSSQENYLELGPIIQLQGEHRIQHMDLIEEAWSKRRASATTL